MDNPENFYMNTQNSQIHYLEDNSFFKDMYLASLERAIEDVEVGTE